jgi:hypothetical protein
LSNYLQFQALKVSQYININFQKRIALNVGNPKRNNADGEFLLVTDGDALNINFWKNPAMKTTKSSAQTSQSNYQGQNYGRQQGGYHGGKGGYGRGYQH